MTLSPGDQVGAYRIAGTYPGGGYRALHVATLDAAHLDVRSAEDWREQAIHNLRASTLVAALAHPGVARILDRGVLADRRTWLASELPEGVPLSDVLARRSLTARETEGLVHDVANVLAHAHERGLVHGAVHHHAIIMRTGERPYPIALGAWGDVFSCAPDNLPPTPPLFTVYTAPELARGRAADGRADVFAIGVLAHRALTDRFPTRPELLADVPDDLAALIVRMLAVDPSHRPTALEVVAATASPVTTDRAMPRERLSRPRWTPAPPTGGEERRVADIIDFAIARRERT